MKIAKIINNNVISSLDENGREIVLMGRGIAYQRRKGDDIDTERIEKRFVFGEHEQSARFLALLENIPSEVVNVVDEVVKHARETLPHTLRDGIYITLTDHIGFTIERYLQGATFKNPMDWEIRRFYREEYAEAEYAVRLINERLHVELPDTEAAFVALHFVEAESDDTMEEVNEITGLIQTVLGIIRFELKLTFDEESVAYQRLVTHIRFFARRVVTEDGQDKGQCDDVLFGLIATRYPEAFSCTQHINAYIEDAYHRSLGQSEKMYLTIHIARMLSGA